jgi:hypothetical protein
MKTKHSKHFYWEQYPKSATAAAELFALNLKRLEGGVFRSLLHVWRDPTFSRTTVEWTEER